VPVSLFVGKHDLLSTSEDDRKTRDLLGPALFEYHELEADHMSLLIGSDMSYFSADVLRILNDTARQSSGTGEDNLLNFAQ